MTTLIGAAGIIALCAPVAMAKESGEKAAAVPTYSFSGAFLAGRAAEADNDLTSAITYYERAIAFDPDNEALQQSLLLALVSEGRFDDALPYARELKSVPEVERFSRLTLAVDDFRNKDFRGAEDWLKLVLQSDLDRLITSVMTGWAKAGAGDVDAALAHLGGLNDPEWFGLFVRYHSALVAAQAGRDAEARKAFQALADTPAMGSVAPETYMRAMEAYAAYLADKGEKDEALAVLDKAETFITGRSATELLRQQIETGETVGPLVTGPAEGAAEILLNVASALNRVGGEPFVQLYLNCALALRPGNDDILVQLASVAEQQGEPERAISYYAQIEADSPWRRMAELQTGLNMADLDRHDEAIAFLEAALEKDPDDRRTYLALGRVHAARKEYSAAADVYDQAVKLVSDPAEQEDWSLFYQRGIAYERLKEWDKAEPNFHKALELYPDQPQVLNYLGYSWVDMNMNLEEGLELIRRAVELRPNDGYIVDSLGWAYYRLGRYEEAADELERAVQLRPGDPVLNDHLGDAYWRVGRRLEANYQWAHARDLDPEPELLAQVEKKLQEGLPDSRPGKNLAEATPSENQVTNEPADAPEAAPQEMPAEDEQEAMPAGEAVEPPPAEEPQEEAPAEEAVEPQAEAPDSEGATASEEPASTLPATYVIKPGESLWSIAAEQLGDGERYRDIIAVNPALQRNPDALSAGQEIILPE